MRKFTPSPGVRVLKMNKYTKHKGAKCHACHKLITIGERFTLKDGRYTHMDCLSENKSPHTVETYGEATMKWFISATRKSDGKRFGLGKTPAGNMLLAALPNLTTTAYTNADKAAAELVDAALLPTINCDEQPAHPQDFAWEIEDGFEWQ